VDGRKRLLRIGLSRSEAGIIVATRRRLKAAG